MTFTVLVILYIKNCINKGLKHLYGMQLSSLPRKKERLWPSGVIGITMPQSLQRAIFFYIGKRFCIRGGEEQRRLGPSQLVRSYNPDCYTYIEHGLKNQTGGLRQLGLENKNVPCPAVPENHLKCLVFLLDKYLRHFPKCFRWRYFLPASKAEVTSKSWRSVVWKFACCEEHTFDHGEANVHWCRYWA